MANRLSFEKQVAVISALAEGSSIRSVERMFGTHRDTVMRLGVRIGEGCTRLLDNMMRDLSCERVQIDELWGFINRKQKNVPEDSNRFEGDVWTFVAMDADSKIVPCFKVGKRDSETANEFLVDLSGRLKNRVQLSSDALGAYVQAVEEGFGGQVDYGQIVKSFSSTEPLPASRRYSPPPIVATRKQKVVGNPDPQHISTSYIESQNLTVRMHCRRLTRLTNAFSRKLRNFKAAIGLHYGYYNFVKRHSTLRMPPALAAGVVDRRWSIEDLVSAASEA